MNTWNWAQNGYLMLGALFLRRIWENQVPFFIPIVFWMFPMQQMCFCEEITSFSYKSTFECFLRRNAFLSGFWNRKTVLASSVMNTRVLHGIELRLHIWFLGANSYVIFEKTMVPFIFIQFLAFFNAINVFFLRNHMVFQLIHFWVFLQEKNVFRVVFERGRQIKQV